MCHPPSHSTWSLRPAHTLSCRALPSDCLIGPCLFRPPHTTLSALLSLRCAAPCAHQVAQAQSALFDEFVHESGGAATLKDKSMHEWQVGDVGGVFAKPRGERKRGCLLEGLLGVGIGSRRAAVCCCWLVDHPTP